MMFEWNGRHLVPRHSTLAEQSFTSGHTYRMAVVAERDTGRTTEQNAKLWAMLGEISEQVEHPPSSGNYWSADTWKAIFLQAAGYPVQIVPSLDGKGLVPIFLSSSRLSKREFAELLDFITTWADERGVQFADMEGVTWQRQNTT